MLRSLRTMANLYWIELFVLQVLMACLSLSQTGIAQLCTCDVAPSCTCGAEHTIIQNQSSTFYQLKGLEVKLKHSANADAADSELWTSRPSSAGTAMKVESHAFLQVRASSGSVIINPMNDSVDRTQFHFELLSPPVGTGKTFVVIYENKWTTARVGAEPTFPDIVSGLDVQSDDYVNVSVTGMPTPSVVSFTRDGSEVNSANYQLKDGVFQFGPVTMSDDGVMYSITVCNCFTNATKTFALNVQFPALGDNITRVDGQSVSLRCNARGNPEPNFIWRFTPDNSSQQTNALSPQDTVPLGGHTYQSIVLLDNSTLEISGTYHCWIDNGLGAAETLMYMYKLESVDSPSTPTVGETSVTDVSVTPSIKQTAGSSSSSPATWIWIVIGIVAAVAIIIIIVGIIVYRRKQKMKNNRRSNRVTEYDTSVDAYADSGPSARREEADAYATTAAARNGTGKSAEENQYAAASEAKRKSEPTEEVDVIEEIEAYAITGGAARYGGAQKSGKNKNVTKAEAKRESEPSKKVEIIGEMEAYATSSEVRGGAAAKASSNPKTSQAKPSENQPSQTPLPVYAAINPAGKKKKPSEKDTQNAGLQYADLDTSDMKPGPVPPAGQGVSYSDMNFEVQPRGSTGPLLGTEQPAPAQPPPGTE